MSGPSSTNRESILALVDILRSASDQAEHLDLVLDSLGRDQLCELVRLTFARPVIEPATGSAAETPGEASADRVCDIAVWLAAAAFGVEPATVLSRDRHRPIADARAVAQAVARSSGLTLTVIAEHFSQHHSNVMHSIKKVAGSPRLQAAADRVASDLATVAFTTETARPAARTAVTEAAEVTGTTDTTVAA